MRGRGQIAELTAIAEPDVGVIVNVGPAHLELLGSLEAIAAAKAELIEGLRARRGAGGARRGSRCWRRTCAPTCARSPSARAGTSRSPSACPTAACVIGADGARDRAVAVVRAGAQPAATCWRPSRPRGRSGSRPERPAGACASRPCAAQRLELAGGVLADRRLLQRQPDVDARRDRRPRRDGARGAQRGGARRHARARSRALARCTARSARTPRSAGVGLLVTVGPLAAEMAARRSPARRARWPTRRPRRSSLPGLLADGDTVLVKGSRGVGPRARRGGSRPRRARAGGSAPTAGGGAVLRGRRTLRRGSALNGAHSLRRHGRAADLHLPQPEVHRVPAQARVRPADPRGRAARATTRRPARRRWAA